MSVITLFQSNFKLFCYAEVDSLLIIVNQSKKCLRSLGVGVVVFKSNMSDKISSIKPEGECSIGMGQQI